jgi:phosphate transport system substrate-binding protein
MVFYKLHILTVLVVLTAAGCSDSERAVPTRGSVTIECDESVFPVMQQEVDDFHRSYPNANVTMRSVEARESIANFVSDSVRVIVTAREFNDEERQAIKVLDIEYKEYKVALDAVVVIGHRSNPLRELRISFVDSIFAGHITRWPGRRPVADPIELAVADINSSTNEVFRNAIMNGGDLALTATYFPTSEKLIEFVKRTPAAIGLTGLAWLQGHQDSLTVFALGDPLGRPDSTQPIGRYYAPIQANIYRGYYAATRPVMIYSREVLRDVSLGFISYVASVKGQQIVLDRGLVPATMPIRLVSLTTDQVK